MIKLSYGKRGRKNISKLREGIRHLQKRTIKFLIKMELIDVGKVEDLQLNRVYQVNGSWICKRPIDLSTFARIQKKLCEVKRFRWGIPTLKNRDGSRNVLRFLGVGKLRSKRRSTQQI